MNFEPFTTWTEINLSALQNNYKQLQSISNRPVISVIKANAYGHGMVEAAKALQQVGAEWFAVARIEEALDLRNAIPAGKILVLGYTAPSFVPQAILQNICLTIYDSDTAKAYSLQAQKNQQRVSVHVKIDTGMSRLGISVEQAVEFLQFLHTMPGISVEGLYTHFACADEPERPETLSQIRKFDDVLDSLSALQLRPAWVHASNSAGVLNFPHARYDLVRCGIAQYGLHPSDKTLLPAAFQPVLSWKTRITSVKNFLPGTGISYNHRYITKNNEKIGVISVGYADGFRRCFNNSVLVRGKLVPIVGTICMDQCMVQLDSVPDVKIGDEVVIIGVQDDQKITAEQIAARWGTINYEVVSGIAARVPRIIVSR